MARESKKNNSRVALAVGPEALEHLARQRAEQEARADRLREAMERSDEEHRRALDVLRDVQERPDGAGHVSRYAALRIREHLTRRRMTQSQLAQQVGLDPMYLSRRLTGHNEFRLGEVVAIAAVLDLAVTEMIPTVVVLPPSDETEPTTTSGAFVTGE